MIGDKVTRTVCGLWVVEGADLYDSSNFSWTTSVIDEPGDAENLVAEEFVRQELMAEIGQRRIDGAWVTPTDVWFGPQHDDYVGRERYSLDNGPGMLGVPRDVLELADPAVPDELVEMEASRGPDDMFTYTVCGRMLNLGDKVCWSTIASNPLMAYFVVWQEMRKRTGDHMLLCAVHPGDVPAV